MVADMTRASRKKPVYIIDGARTPFLRARGQPGVFSAAELALQSAQPLMLRQAFSSSDLDEVILGCVVPSPDECNIARVVSLRLGCGHSVPAWTVQRNCASGMQAVDSAARNIANGYSDLVLAGGVEAMSRSPVLFNDAMVLWLSQLNQAKSVSAKLKTLGRFRPKHLKPVLALLRGLTDPVVGLSMGKTAELVASQFAISREEMDTYAMHSHARLSAAQQDGRLNEIEVIYDANGHYYDHDDGVRPDTDLVSLARLKPVFDRRYGAVTAGNSAQVTDGAAWLLLASEQAVKDHDLTPLGRIVDCQWSGLAPEVMGLGPAYAINQILGKHKLSLARIDEWEINEAFAAQVLACRQALADRNFCRDKLHRRSPVGLIDLEKLNTNGGGISLGHPVGASGARIVLHVLHRLLSQKTQYGIASLCIGGGQGGAMLVTVDG